MTEQEKKDWFKVEVVQQQILLANSYAADGAVADLRDTLRWALGECGDLMESPLEAIFRMWWEAIAQRNPLSSGIPMCVEHQREVVARERRYRLDFVVHPGLSGSELCEKHGLVWPLIGVEVDGHAFHEKTLDQATARNQRDRDLQQLDWKVFHYSYSEIVRDPFLTVGEVYRFAQRTWWEIEREIWCRENPEKAAQIQAALDKRSLKS